MSKVSKTDVTKFIKDVLIDKDKYSANKKVYIEKIRQNDKFIIFIFSKKKKLIK